MIKDAKGRKWYLRFEQYQQGWVWEARCGNAGQSCEFFAIRALAEADAQRRIPSRDSIAEGAEYIRRLRKRGGAACQITADDHKAIDRAGRGGCVQIELFERPLTPGATLAGPHATAR